MKLYKYLTLAVVFSGLIFSCEVDDDASPLSSGQTINMELADAGNGIIFLETAGDSQDIQVNTSAALPNSVDLVYSANGVETRENVNATTDTTFNVEVPFVNGFATLTLNEANMLYSESSGNSVAINQDKKSVTYASTRDMLFELAWESESDLDFRIDNSGGQTVFQSAAVTNPEGVILPAGLADDTYSIFLTPFSTVGEEDYTVTTTDYLNGVFQTSGTATGLTPATGFFTITYTSEWPLVEVTKTSDVDGNPVWSVVPL